MLSLSVTLSFKVASDEIWLQAVPKGGTDFWAGLRCAFDAFVTKHALEKWLSASGNVPMQPVIILLSDSGDWDQHGSLTNLQQAMITAREAGVEPYVHALGYGRHINNSYLQQVANVGKGSFVACPDAAANVAADVARLQLVGAFEQLADRPDKSGLLMIK